MNICSCFTCAFFTLVMSSSIKKSLTRLCKSDFYLGGRFFAITPFELHQQLVRYGLPHSISEDAIHQFITSRGLETVSCFDLPDICEYCFDRSRVLSMLSPTTGEVDD